MDQLADITLHYYIYIFNSNYKKKNDMSISLIITPQDELVARPQWVTQSGTHQLWRDTQRVLSSDVNYVGELETANINKHNQWKLNVYFGCL